MNENIVPAPPWLISGFDMEFVVDDRQNYVRLVQKSVLQYDRPDHRDSTAPWFTDSTPMLTYVWAHGGYVCNPVCLVQIGEITDYTAFPGVIFKSWLPQPRNAKLHTKRQIEQWIRRNQKAAADAFNKANSFCVQIP